MKIKIKLVKFEMVRNLLLLLLREEAEDEEILLALLAKRKGKEIKNMYKSRDGEGYSSILIRKHLLDDKETFRRFF